ncbi:MAG: FtsX-like permease family protein [Rhodanobacteraceae bacterium]
MQIRPILATLRHHKLTALLLTLQVALTCAIVCNVVFMISKRVQQITLPSGIAEDGLSVIHSTGIDKNESPQAQHAVDLAALRAIPGVASAVAVSDSLPLNRNDDSYGTCPSRQAFQRAMQLHSGQGAGCLEPSAYDGTPGLIQTLGLKLIAGRDFQPDEYTTSDKPPVAILTRALAQRMYPKQFALGKTLYTPPGEPTRVVGVVDNVLRPDLREPGTEYDSMIWPHLPNESSVLYVLRSAPRDRDRVLKAAQAGLLAVNPDRIIDPKKVQTYAQIRAQYFQRDTTMIGLLIASALGLLFVTALGITGLANFWVQQRTRTIGIRRALGARRVDILRYFQTENFLIVTFGIVLGMVLAFAINLTLMKFYELPRLPFFYLPIGAVALWLLGQLAVLGPALRASHLPPVVATRTV